MRVPNRSGRESEVSLAYSKTTLRCRGPGLARAPLRPGGNLIISHSQGIIRCSLASLWLFDQY